MVANVKIKNIWLFFQLRYLQTLNSISAENNSTIIFPVPIDIINSFMTPTANPTILPFQHYNLHQQFHKAQMMNVKQRPPLVPTHSKVSKVSKKLTTHQSVNTYQKDDFLLFSNDLLQKVDNRDLIQKREGLIELLYCLLLCSVLPEVPNDNDSQNRMCWADMAETPFFSIRNRDRHFSNPKNMPLTGTELCLIQFSGSEVPSELVNFFRRHREFT